MFGILAEDRSDAAALVALVRNILGDQSISIKRKGYGGCGELCRKGACQLSQFLSEGVDRFIVCHDADGAEPDPIIGKLKKLIIGPSNVSENYCLLVPIQEIEAWVIADEDAIAKVIPSFQLKPHQNPESIDSPKEWLIRKSRVKPSKPLFVPTIHNEKVLANIDAEKVKKKCASFRVLCDFLAS